MIESPGSDGTPDWFFLPEDSTLTEGTRITFVEWVRVGGPPGLRYAKQVVVVGSPVGGGIMKTDTSPPPEEPPPLEMATSSPPKLVWGGKLPSSISSGSTSVASSSTSTATISPPKPKPKPTSTTPVGPTFSSSQVADDYNNVVNAVNRMDWSGKFGPSVKVETKLDWDDPACRELFLTLKDRYHDNPILGIRRRLYYYFGAIGNWGKAGFRISGHTKTSDKVKQSDTHGVLHVEN